MSSRRSDAYRPFAAGGASMRVAAIVVGLGAFGPAQAQDAVRSPVASAPTQEPAAPEAGPDADARGTWSVTFENDIFGDEDRDYTNGVRLDYVTPRNNLSAAGRLAKRGLYGWFSDASDWYGLYTLGQNIYTPSDISLKTPPKTDRPYAGFLYLGAGVAADRGDRLDTLSVEIGIVGPSSLAEESQTIVHEIIGAQEPRGWHNQLDDELGLRLLYERKWKFSADVPVPPSSSGLR